MARSHNPRARRDPVEDRHVLEGLDFIACLIARGVGKFADEALMDFYTVEVLPGGDVDIGTVSDGLRELALKARRCPGVALVLSETYPAKPYPPLRLPSIQGLSASDPKRTRAMIRAADCCEAHLKFIAANPPMPQVHPIVTAVLMGHMVRIYKLYASVSLLLRNGRLEPAEILLRSFVETLLSLSVLMTPASENDLRARVRDFLDRKPSLESDRADYARLAASQKVDTETAIRATAMWGTADYRMGHEDLSPSAGARGAKAKAAAIGRDDLYGVFAEYSEAVHGGWPDLRDRHLWFFGLAYRPRIEFAEDVHGVILSFASMLAAGTARYYVDFAYGGSLLWLVKRLWRIERWFSNSCDAVPGTGPVEFEGVVPWEKDRRSANQLSLPFAESGEPTL